MLQKNVSSKLPSKLRLKILSDPANLAEVRQSIEKLCGDSGFEREACDEVGLCVNEALANVIRHAYHGAKDKPIEISAELTDDLKTIQIAIRDWGNGVNPEELPPRPRDPFKPGGLGLICLRRMMDPVRFSPQPDGGMLLEMSRTKKN